MKQNINQDIVKGGVFVCLHCQSKSKLSFVPRHPGVYKISCYYCKKATYVHVNQDQNGQLQSYSIGEKKNEANPNIGTEDKNTKKISKPLLQIKKATHFDGDNQTKSTTALYNGIKTTVQTDLSDYPQKKSWKIQIFLGLLVFLLLSLSGLVFIVYQRYQEVEAQITEYLLELDKNKPTLITDRNGKLISEIYQKKISAMKIEDYPSKLIEVVTGVEDRNFFSHHGIDYLAILRAAYKNIYSMGYQQGASTITQQLSRILLKDRRKSLLRKYKEAELAFALESKLSKKEILEAYMNQVYLGHGAFGFENAASYYFAKTPMELNGLEMILLASLASAPNKYSPFKNPDISKTRVKILVNALAKKEIIPSRLQERIDEFYRKLKPPPYQTVFGARYDIAPYVTEHIRELLIKSVDSSTNIYDIGGYHIETTLLKEAQELVSIEVEKHLQFLKKQGIVQKVRVRNFSNYKEHESGDLQAAIIAIDPTSGEVLFMHGGGEQFNINNQFNRAIQMRRQTGSAIKPILYAAAIDASIISPSTNMMDAPQMLKGWNPSNYGMSYEGEMSVRQALVKSKNTIAAQIGERLGFRLLEKYYSDFFFPDPEERNKRFRKEDLTIALGTLEISPLEMAIAYGTFSNDGIINRPYLVKKITSSSGEVVYDHIEGDEFQLKIPPMRRVIKADTSEVMISLMKSSANASGIRRVGYTSVVAGKTGTTNDNVDAWFVGTRPRFSMSVWVGYDDASFGMGNRAMGSTTATPLWGNLAKKLDQMKLLPKDSFKFSTRASWASICKDSGLLSTDKCHNKVMEIFTRSSKPHEACRLPHESANTKEVLKTLF
ncbi:MAG: transglycosylase domain-containing protein [Leptospiraceae bacterium]|nr:transglycosylase domain-containing protein [Leptospiraceae bacterium]MCP5498186.1 transglycosylase domain-containing protein [Leptospiraceae bacterium]